MPPTQETPRIRSGQRVRCLKTGAFNGLVGRVEDVWDGQALVYFSQGTAINEPVDCFEVLRSKSSQSQSPNETDEFEVV